MTAAKAQGERLFSELLGEHRSRLKEDRERAKYAYDARYQAIGRIGLPTVREHRRKRLDAEHQARMAALDDAEASVPDLNALAFAGRALCDGTELAANPAAHAQVVRPLRESLQNISPDLIDRPGLPYTRASRSHDSTARTVGHVAVPSIA